jgi:predicted O-methyltransferase YrrM
MERFDPAWALRPEALELLAELVREGRTTVVECGSGLSTVTIAKELRELGEGRVHALEHSPEWAAATRAALAGEAVEEHATVIDAPLRDGWYDRAALERLPASGVDLLLVDGPPANDPGIQRSRYPALPALAERLAPGAAIVLDDADPRRRALGVRALAGRIPNRASPRAPRGCGRDVSSRPHAGMAGNDSER